MKPVLCIRHEPEDDLGIAAECLAGAGCRIAVLDAWDGAASWPSVDEVAGLVVFGGSMNVDEAKRHPFLLRTRAMMTDAVAARIPTLGICLGAQALTRACASPVIPSSVNEIGFVPIALTPEGEGDPLLSSFATGDRVFQWHRDTCVMPAGAVLLATGVDVEVQAFRLGDRAWGVQFHPEVTEGELEAWMATEGAQFERRWGRTIEDVRAEIVAHLGHQQRRGAELFERFAAVTGEAG